VADAYEYLLEHFKEYDFIWSSPPCPSHSRFRKNFSIPAGAKPLYPDMKLYEEILLLQSYYKGKYCVENVISFYKPLVTPQVLQRHYFWTNFIIQNAVFQPDNLEISGRENKNSSRDIQKRLEKTFGFSLDKYKINKMLVLRNCVSPELGLHILNGAMGKNTQNILF